MFLISTQQTVLASPSIISLLGVRHICLHKQCVVLRFFPTPNLLKAKAAIRPKPTDLHRKSIECFLYDGNFEI